MEVLKDFEDYENKRKEWNTEISKDFPNIGDVSFEVSDVVDLASDLSYPELIIIDIARTKAIMYDDNTKSWSRGPSADIISKYIYGRLKDRVLEVYKSSPSCTKYVSSCYYNSSIIQRYISQKNYRPLEAYIDSLSNFIHIEGNTLDLTTLITHQTSMKDFAIDSFPWKIDQIGCKTSIVRHPLTLGRNMEVCGRLILSILGEGTIPYLYSMATALSGSNPNKIILIHVGKKNTGKTLLQQLIFAAFPNKCEALPVSALSSSGPRIGSPSPEYSYLFEKLYVYIPEASTSTIFNNGAVKGMTGNDLKYSRRLYENGSSKRVSALISLSANDSSVLRTNDPVLMDRMMVIFHNIIAISKESYYSKSHEERIKYNVKDVNLVKQVNELGPAMFALICYYYNQWLQHGDSEVSKKYIQRGDDIKIMHSPVCKTFLALSKGFIKQSSVDEIYNTINELLSKDKVPRSKQDFIDILPRLGYKVVGERVIKI